MTPLDLSVRDSSARAAGGALVYRGDDIPWVDLAGVDKSVESTEIVMKIHSVEDVKAKE